MNTVAVTPGGAEVKVKRSPLGRFSDVLYRRPNLYLLLLLVPPLLWFGSVYIASLLSLLWQGFYTFDDFTMLVDHTLTLSNYAQLFDAANFDIILPKCTNILPRVDNI